MNWLVTLVLDQDRIVRVWRLQEGIADALQDQLLARLSAATCVLMDHCDGHGAPGLQSEVIGLFIPLVYHKADGIARRHQLRMCPDYVVVCGV